MKSSIFKSLAVTLGLFGATTLLGAFIIWTSIHARWVMPAILFGILFAVVWLSVHSNIRNNK